MDLSTTYMGLQLKHPVVASASPLSATLDGFRRMEDGGVAAVVMFSIFEEQVREENEAFSRLMEAGSESYPESLNYFPEVSTYEVGPDRYLELIRRATEQVDVPVIASMNCATTEGWIEYAKQMEQAGAHGLELNIYRVEADFGIGSLEVEQHYLDILAMVKSAVSIPVALKLSPFFSATGNLALRLDQAGADALVLFNRFYQPDIDITDLEVASILDLSTASEIRLPLLWTALLCGKVNASLGTTTGVEGAEEVIKYLLAGADVVMSTSALLRHGPAYAATMVDGLKDWMEAREFSSVAQLRGNMSHGKVANPSAFERANYIKILQSFRGEMLSAWR
ncbi:dihydroorotate dehydrogenase-like protein [Thiohalomonas denitrificans]|uniref:Dihydroorotate dehydrogenase (Fumarate) n=1 Tax=Thiohalomonas denitrificans TaxID=415747 RepID=A0A1G5Q6Y8_9GAMM|nr:dihydroorotate dehydrogenase-like protein [Thiohalomonas denitrificans]SCZ57437.1 dihydroorotate dehydrogenase (fumarate) [Thiohalomonas denitrificans]